MQRSSRQCFCFIASFLNHERLLRQHVRALGECGFCDSCDSTNEPRKQLFCMCCTGFYGTSETQTFNEDSSAGQDFLAEVCREWEATARKAQVDRIAILRTGS